MTDYIEEMMRTAVVEADSSCAPIGADCSKGCDNCQRNNIKYPDFTPAKQLEIIKLISKNKIGKDYSILEIEKDEIEDLYYITSTNREDKLQSTYVSNKDFIQALARLTTELMKAGELDKEKVKEILEG